MINFNPFKQSFLVIIIIVLLDSLKTIPFGWTNPHSTELSSQALNLVVEGPWDLALATLPLTIFLEYLFLVLARIFFAFSRGLIPLHIPVLAIWLLFALSLYFFFHKKQFGLLLQSAKLWAASPHLKHRTDLFAILQAFPMWP